MHAQYEKKITTELAKRVSKRDITITSHYLKINRGKKNIELSNYIWELKENGKNHTIDWLIAMKTHPYICGTKKCDSCLCEKSMIARASSASLLNKLDEIVSKCRHMNNTEVF